MGQTLKSDSKWLQLSAVYTTPRGIQLGYKTKKIQIMEH